MWGGFVTSTWTMSVDVSLSTCTSTAEDAKGKTMWPSMSRCYLYTYDIPINACWSHLKLFLFLFFFCLVLWFFFSIFFYFFLLSRFPPKCGAGSLSTPIKCCCCPEAITQQKKNGRHWQRRGMGPIILLTSDFIPRVKGLLSVTFTWFKSLAQLNQKSMKSFGYIFGLSCQHFKLGTIVFFFSFGLFWDTNWAKKCTERQWWPSFGLAEIWQLTEKYHP